MRSKSRVAIGVVVVGLVASGLMAVSPATASYVPQTSLRALFPFDESSGTTTTDAVGGLTGQAEGATWTTGHTGSALLFDGTDDVRISTAPALEPDRITVEAWVRAGGPVPAPAAGEMILAKGASGCTSASYGFFVPPDGGLAWSVGSPLGPTGEIAPLTVAPAGLASALWDGQWHNIVGTFDEDTVALFLDGRLVGQMTSPGPNAHIGYGLPNGSDLLIGRYGATCAGTSGFVGSIDNIEVWGQALPAADVLAGSGKVLPLAIPMVVASCSGSSSIPIYAGVRTVIPLCKSGPGSVSWLSWQGSGGAGGLVNDVLSPDSPDLRSPSWQQVSTSNPNTLTLQDALNTYAGSTVGVTLFDGTCSTTPTSGLLSDCQWPRESIHWWP